MKRMKKIISLGLAVAFILNIFGPGCLLAVNPGANKQFTLRAPVETDQLEEAINSKTEVKPGEVIPPIDEGKVEPVKSNVQKKKYSISDLSKKLNLFFQSTYSKLYKFIFISKEYQIMSAEFKKAVLAADDKLAENIFTEIRQKAREQLGENKIDENEADEAILLIKGKLIVQLMKEAKNKEKIKERLVGLFLNQAKQYFNLVNGYGGIKIDDLGEIAKIEDGDLDKKEDEHEDVWFASMQAIDALRIVGAKEAVDVLEKISGRGLEAHRLTVGQNAKLEELDLVRRKQDRDKERQLEIELGINTEAMRRWTEMEIMLLKALTHLALAHEKTDPKKFEQVNNWLIGILLDYQSTGEGFYWLRQNAAFRLKDFYSKQTLKALQQICDPETKEGQIPNPDTIYISLNLEAANKEAISLHLPAGYSLVHLRRHKTFLEIKENVNEFVVRDDFEEKENRFARLIGIGDVLISPEIDGKVRVALLNRLANIEDEEFALAANILLDTLQEMVEKKPGEIFENNGRKNILKEEGLPEAAFQAFLRIACSLKSVKCKISKNRFRPDDFDIKEIKDTLKNREAIENVQKRKVSRIIYEMLRLKNDADIDKLEKKDICKAFNDIFKMNIIYSKVKKKELTVSENEEETLEKFYNSFFGSEVKDDKIKEITKKNLEAIFPAETRYSNTEIVLNRNEKLKTKFEAELNRLAGQKFVFNREGREQFAGTVKNVHIILGNLHRFGELQDFKDGENYLKLDREIIVESGGGASAAISGVLERITLSRWLDVISGTDSGGGSLLTRGSNVRKSGILTCAQGDVVRNDAETAKMERVKAALITKQLLDYRFGPRGESKETFAELLEKYRKDLFDKARDSNELDRFEDVFQQALGIAEFTDEMGMNWTMNSVKNLLFEGVQYYTGGYDQELMNPDAIYAGLIEFRDFCGAEGFAVFDQPFGNIMHVHYRDGREKIDQPLASHTPNVPALGRKRKVYEMYDIDNYFPEIAIHSRVASAVKNAKLIISGLCSWGTSLGILLKNKGLVKAMMVNKQADKVLFTDPVLDDENTLSFLDSTENLLNRVMGAPIQKVWNKVLINSNEGIGRKWILPARKEMGKFLDAFLGAFGGYRGPNTASPQDIKRLKKLGLKVYNRDQMVEVELQPKRNDPDSYIASILAIPESLAKALWQLMSDSIKKQLKTQDVFQLIVRHEEIEKLLKEAGLSWLSFGMETPHELICRPQLAKELKLWLDEGKKPEWVMDKKIVETWFQYTVRKAAVNLQREVVDPRSIKVDNFIDLGRLGSKEVKVKFLSGAQTNKFFAPEDTNRILNQTKEENLKKEEIHRLGIILDPSQTEDGSIQILFPNELLEMGDTPAERIKRIETVLRFQLEKAEKLLEKGFQNEDIVHQELLRAINDRSKLGKDKEYIKILGELSIALPYLAWLRRTITAGNKPVVAFDMDGTFTAAGTKLTPWMAYCALRFFRDSSIVKEVLTAQAFEGPMKQIYEEVCQIERRLELAEVRTGVKRPSSLSGLDKVFNSVVVGGSSGNAVFVYDHNEEGYVKIWQNSIPEIDLKLIELAGRITMPKISYGVTGHQIERREPAVKLVAPDEKNILKRFIRESFAAVAIIPSGRYDLIRSFDRDKIVRTKQGMLISVLLKDPQDMLEKIKPLIEGGKNEWTIDFERNGKNYQVQILAEQQQFIREMYNEIAEVRKKQHLTVLKPVNVSVQPGGQTTIDVSPTPKSVGIFNGLQLIAKKLGVNLEQFRIGFLGDEVAEFRKSEGKDIYFDAEGNDLSVAKDSHPQLDYIAHVGEKGKTESNTTVTYEEEGTIPDVNDLILANASLSLKRGEKRKEVLQRKEAIINDLKKRGLSIEFFGAKELEEINERQAEEILAMLKITVQEAICDQIKLVQQFVKKDSLTENEVQEITNLWEMTEVKGNPEKQALLYYLLNKDLRPQAEGEEILFAGIKKEDVHILVKEGRVVLYVRDRIIDGVREISKGKIFADLNNNFVLSGEKFKPELLKILQKLILSGVFIPELLSDNNWENAQSKFEDLPEGMEGHLKLWEAVKVVVDGGAVRYNAAGKKDDQYDTGTKITGEEFDEIEKEVFQAFIDFWQPFWFNLTRYLDENRRSLPDVERKKNIDGLIKVLNDLGISKDILEDLVKLLSRKDDFADKNIKGLVNYLLKISNLSDNKERVESIRSMEKILDIVNIDEEKRFRFYQLWAVVEIIRVLQSEHKRDKIEKASILKAILEPSVLRMERREEMQGALKPIRPKLIRDLCTDYFVSKLERLQERGELKRFKIYEGGMTTANIKDNNLSKVTPIEWSFNQEKIQPDYMLYLWSNGKPEIGAADVAVGQFLSKKEFENLLVIATSEKKPDFSIHRGLLWSRNLGVLGNKYGPEANIAVLEQLKTIYEESMDRLLSDRKYQPKPAIEVFREKISTGRNNKNSNRKIPKPGIFNFPRPAVSKYL
ncbi:MAG: hypothetical protein ABII74_00820 [Elusimicrobiota bacterium]